jgi:hypothetical protein
MKRTWIVIVEQGFGHELHNSISDSEWYGPFTETQAKNLSKKLNKILADPNDREHPVAQAMPLKGRLIRSIIKEYYKEI